MAHAAPLTILATAYWSPVDYLLAIQNAQTARLEWHEHYQKQSYRNRTTICGANGPEDLIVPIRLPHGTHTPIAEAQPDYSVPWPHQHLHAISSAYGKSPFYIHFFPQVQLLLTQQYPTLLQLNSSLLAFLCTHLHIQTPIDHTPYFQAHYPAPTLDLRYAIHPKHPRPCSLRYFQQFETRYGFLPNASALDLLFQRGEL